MGSRSYEFCQSVWGNKFGELQIVIYNGKGGKISSKSQEE